MAMLNAPTMECDRVNLRRSVPVQKRQQIFETVPVRHRGTSFGHLTAKLLKMRAGIDIVRVPYPGAASVIPDLFAGRVQALVDPIVSSIEHIRAGRLRPLKR
jgi:tripartite-type tricarboxylate transporter receptor subunit TctC